MGCMCRASTCRVLPRCAPHAGALALEVAHVRASTGHGCMTAPWPMSPTMSTRTTRKTAGAVVRVTTVWDPSDPNAPHGERRNLGMDKDTIVTRVAAGTHTTKSQTALIITQCLDTIMQAVQHG